jgi:pilus assembly protein CpaE
VSIEILLASGSERTRQRMAHMLAEAEGLKLVQMAGDGPAVADTLERNAKIDVVILDETLEDGQGHAVARAVGASNPLVGIVMLVESAGPEQFRAAMDSGARSVVSESSSLDEIVSRIEAVAQWVAAARSAVTAELNGGRGGRVVAVAGAKGGVGTTSVALLVARGLTAIHTVSLIDFDLQSGDLAAYAGVHTRRSLVDLVDIAGEMSGRVLRETSYDIEGGLRLLPAPNDGERAEEMTGEAARAIVNALRYQFDVSVIDVGSRLDDATALVLEYADAALLVATPDLPALRSARKTLAMWERLAVRAPASVDLVLNRRTNRSEVQESLAQRIVEAPVALVIPDGGVAFESAMNTATILSASTPAHSAAASFGAVLDKRLAAPTVDAGPVRVGVPVIPAPDTGQNVAPAGSRRSHRGDDRGQSTVELPIAIAMALFIFLVCAQGIVWGVGFMLARNAAQAGARTMGIARTFDPSSIGEARGAALGELSGPWKDRASVDVRPETVRVSIVAPTIIPGVDLTSEATAAVFTEPR